MISIGGITKLSATDYPGHLAAVLFCQGCPLKCLYCHNHHLQKIGCKEGISWQAALDFLEARVGLLDAVVFSGGEPCMQSKLDTAISQVRELGFKIGLHTSGIYPDNLRKIVDLLDWVGLDIKATQSAYSRIVGVKVNYSKIEKSLDILLGSKVDLECRMTVHTALTDSDQIFETARKLSGLGVRTFALQAYNRINHDPHNLNSNNQSGFVSSAEFRVLNDYFENFIVRDLN